jgi:hypothetical protein
LKIHKKISIFTKIVLQFQIKIYLLFLILCCGAFSANIDTSKNVQQCLNTYLNKVSFRRIQTYRSVVLEASGRADYDRNEKIVVTYNRPFKQTVSYSDTATITISKDKKTYTNSGFRDAVECDPFQALMIVCSARTQNLQYIGAFDSIWIYDGDFYGKKCRFSIDRISQLVRDIAYVNASGAVYERMLFYYKKDYPMPSSVVVLKSTGGELVRDSVRFETK